MSDKATLLRHGNLRAKCELSRLLNRGLTDSVLKDPFFQDLDSPRGKRRSAFQRSLAKPLVSVTSLNTCMLVFALQQSSKAWFREHEHFRRHMDWPPQTPDQNLRENLWDMQEKALYTEPRPYHPNTRSG